MNNFIVLTINKDLGQGYYGGWSFEKDGKLYQESKLYKELPSLEYLTSLAKQTL